MNKRGGPGSRIGRGSLWLLVIAFLVALGFPVAPWLARLTPGSRAGLVAYTQIVSAAAAALAVIAAMRAAAGSHQAADEARAAALNAERAIALQRPPTCGWREHLEATETDLRVSLDFTGDTHRDMRDFEISAIPSWDPGRPVHPRSPLRTLPRRDPDRPPYEPLVRRELVRVPRELLEQGVELVVRLEATDSLFTHMRWRNETTLQLSAADLTPGQHHATATPIGTAAWEAVDII